MTTVALVLALALGLSACAQASSSATGSVHRATTLSARSRTRATAGGAFRGVFEFGGQNSPQDATDPDLAGVDLVFYWSQLEPERGVYDWAPVTEAMAPWVAAGKAVILRVSTSGAPSWDPPYSGSATPAWVYGLGVGKVEAAGATIPVYWDPAFLQAYRTFVRAFARHVGHDPDVALVEAGIGFGGETLPETNASAQDVATWTRDGYSDARWLATVETIASYYGRAFRRIPVYALVDRTFFDGSGTDFERVLTWVTSRKGWGLQDDGLTATQTLEPAWSTVPLALEQLEPTSTSGDCLCQDVANAITRLRGQYLIVYKSDVEDPANATALAEAARAVGSVAPAS